MEKDIPVLERVFVDEGVLGVGVDKEIFEAELVGTEDEDVDNGPDDDELLAEDDVVYRDEPEPIIDVLLT